jgi:hypothetical protein
VLRAATGRGRPSANNGVAANFNAAEQQSFVIEEAEMDGDYVARNNTGAEMPLRCSMGPARSAHRRIHLGGTVPTPRLRYQDADRR